MLVTFEGEDYQFDLDEVDLNEARFIKRNTGLSLYRFQEGVIECDPDCLALAFWLMLKQNGKKVQDPTKMNFKVGKFSIALTEAYKAEAKRQEELELSGGSKEAGEGNGEAGETKTE